jgi:transposase
MDRDSLKLLLDQGLSLEQIGRRVGRHPSTVGYWVKKHGLRAAHKDRHANKGTISRERLAALIEEGATHRFMAAVLGVSVATVRHWLTKYGLETARGERIRHDRAERDSGRGVVELPCKTHGRTLFRLEGRGLYRCIRCRSEAVSKRRTTIRATLVSEAGGCCAACGYDRFAGALQFHHLDPSEKEFGISSRGVTRSLAAARAEASKCVLLCANCHAEVEGGARTLSVESLGSLKSGRSEVDYPA